MEITNDITLREVFDMEMIAECSNIKDDFANMRIGSFAGDENNLEDVLNKLFPDYDCVNVHLTNNTDKVLFGVYVNPTILDADVAKILIDTEPVELKRYMVEVDLKICNFLEPAEIAAYIVDDIACVMGTNGIEGVRSIIDGITLANNDIIDLKASVNYSQILIFGIKSTLINMQSLAYKPVENLGFDPYAVELSLSGLLSSCKTKLMAELLGAGEETSAAVKLGVMNWCLNIYRNVSDNYRLAEEILLKSAAVTGSSFELSEIDKTLKCIRRALNEITTEAVDLIAESKGKMSLFKSIKQTGLRGIEDDLYEFRIRLKNCDNEDEAMYILRQINSRMGVLQDYIENTPDLSETDKARWQGVLDSYQQLRIDLATKKIGVKTKLGQYGIFVNYDEIDKINY